MTANDAATNGRTGKHPVSTLEEVLVKNKHWATEFRRNPANKERIEASAEGQSPRILWVGCSDSRVPETTITNLSLGDVFVHRNIANIVRPIDSEGFQDASLWSSIEYSLSEFPIHTIVICGHTDCGGAIAALTSTDGLPRDLQRYLAPLVALRKQNQSKFTHGEAKDAKLLARLNVLNGVEILKRHPAVQSKGVQVRGAMYDVASLDIDAV